MAGKTSAGDRRLFNETLKSARIGLLQAQYEVGLMLANGVGVEQDFAQAVAWIRQAADRGLAAAQYLLASRYASGGAGIERDDPQAAAWYLKAAEQGHAKAFYRLGKLYAQASQELGQACFLKAAALGVAEAQLAVGAAFASGRGAEQDLHQALAWYQKAAEQGLAAAQHALAGLYAQGQGVEVDQDEALLWYRRAAEQSFAPAQVAMEMLDAGTRARSSARARGRRKAGAAERRRDPARWAESALAGDADARFHLGLMYERGLGVPQDEAQAQVWYQSAAEQGDARAQLALARLLELRDPAAALDWYGKSAAQGEREAQRVLGKRYATGQGVAENLLRGAAWTMRAGEDGDPDALVDLGRLLDDPQRLARACYTQAAEQGAAEAQYVLGQYFSTGQGVARDPRMAFLWWQRAADQGHAPAQCAVAGCYLAGKGVGKDFKQAFDWFREAADQGEARAQWNLGSLYASGGEGLKQDMRQAFVWCRKAADQGFVAALATLGVLYARVDNPAQALACWSQAAELGDAEAQYNLALLHTGGKSVTQDAGKVLHWLGKAAAQGLAAAQSRLGLMYATGDTVPQDGVEAHKWFMLAAMAGDTAGKANLARSESLLDPLQVKEAQRRAREWAHA